MTRKPAAPANLRNGLKWRDGRPRWEPSPANRACGFAGRDLKTAAGEWMDRGAATTAADARTLWAGLVRDALKEDDAGGRARARLRTTLELMPSVAADPYARSLVADLIERGRAVIEDREPGVTAALSHGPRTVNAMIDGFFADAEAMRRISRATQRAYRQQAKKLALRFGSRRVDEITRPQMRTWYLELQREFSIPTANQCMGMAGALFRWATWQDPAWIDISPCEKIGRDASPGRRVFYTPEEETAFVAWADANGFADVADCFTACLWTGARQIDVAALDDVSSLLRSTWRYIPEKTKRKGQEALPGLLPPVARRAERRRLEATSDRTVRQLAIPFLWDVERGRRHTSDTIGTRFREARAAFVLAMPEHAAFGTKQLRDTRDTCVTRLWAANVPMQKICSWGGWAYDTANAILKDHYLSLLEAGAEETADQLKAWAVAQGLDMAAA